MTARSIEKFVYRFDSHGTTEGDATMRHFLGGKGANLAEMARIGFPVPPGFTLSAALCDEVLAHGGKLPEYVLTGIEEAVRWLEGATGKRLGDPERPLLLSVRSGAAVSMPGMMDTVLNLGMTENVVRAIAARPEDTRFAWDSWRRFIDMFGSVVHNVSHHAFEEVLDDAKRARGVTTDHELDAEALQQVANGMLAVFKAQVGYELPQDPRAQLHAAVLAVFRSWNSERAVKYREIHGMTGLLGTAVNVQSMVFGNKGSDSGTAVCFTRDPATGKPGLYGELLVDAQGEDVVAGIRTPEPVAAMKDHWPALYDQLVGLCAKLEAHFGNMQDIELTIERGKLYLLQTRHGKRTGPAAVRIAVDLVREGAISTENAVRNLVDPDQIDQCLHPRFADEGAYRNAGKVLAKGLPASPGAAVGRIVFNAEDAVAWAARGEKVILVRAETSPEDVAGMHAAKGILTTRGGMTSHAAVVARGWGRPCIVGCGVFGVDERNRKLKLGDRVFEEGEWFSLNGTSGEVVLGAEPMTDATLDDNFQTFMGWCDEHRRLGVRANADAPHDAEVARRFGAAGIGLCRTEHMFFGEDRINPMRRMIVAETETERRAALAVLLPLQRADFLGLFKAMGAYPVTIRLLDPPLHEFLPHEREAQLEVARLLHIPVETVKNRVEHLAESNPMLGHRGCRLGITFPEITEMQATAIYEAAVDAAEAGVDVHPEVMVPLVGTHEELAHQRAVILRMAEEVFTRRGRRVPLKVGTMIEVPRAALRAGEIAKHADFFSFGTNDLTQMTYGYSRDDVGRFLPSYLSQGILPVDPFKTLDPDGVGELVATACERGRKTRPTLSLGICGEHGGDPASIATCHKIGLDYVSCSPYRVPAARLAAAQAALKEKGGKDLQGER
jgi:pyruvate,orthophosphate dikinase